MKKQNLKDLKAKTLKELKDLLTVKSKELFSLRMDKTLAKLKNTRIVFHKRKEIAVIKTLKRQREENE